MAHLATVHTSDIKKCINLRHPNLFDLVEPGAVVLLLQVEGEDLHPGLVGYAEQGQAWLHARKHK
jgi:hypothetical protein